MNKDRISIAMTLFTKIMETPKHWADYISTKDPEVAELPEGQKLALCAHHLAVDFIAVTNKIADTEKAANEAKEEEMKTAFALRQEGAPNGSSL